jgi:hypothetical protein
MDLFDAQQGRMNKSDKKNATKKPHLRGGLILKSQKEIASQELSTY